jgi:hypothetical protein
MYIIHLPNGLFAADDSFDDYSDMWDDQLLDSPTVEGAKKFVSYQQAEHYRDSIALWAGEWVEDDGTADLFREAKIECW